MLRKKLDVDVAIPRSANAAAFCTDNVRLGKISPRPAPRRNNTGASDNAPVSGPMVVNHNKATVAMRGPSSMAHL